MSAVQDLPLPGRLMVTALAMAHYADSHARGCYASLATLAGRAGKSVRQTQRDMRELELAGVTVERRAAGVPKSWWQLSPDRRPRCWDLKIPDRILSGYRNRWSARRQARSWSRADARSHGVTPASPDSPPYGGTGPPRDAGASRVVPPKQDTSDLEFSEAYLAEMRNLAWRPG